MAAQPSSVDEGTAVQVTVSRDGAVGASQIDVETMDGSAHGGEDYTPVPRRTISFTNETSQTFAVQTRDDTVREAAETFRVHLSNPGGCTVNPNFRVGPDATVTIDANDDSPGTTASGGAATTSGGAATTRPAASSTALPESGLDSTTAPPTLPPIPDQATATTFGVATTGEVDIALAEQEDGGIGPAAVIVLLAGAAGLGGAGWWTWRRRMARPVGPG